MGYKKIGLKTRSSVSRQAAETESLLTPQLAKLRKEKKKRGRRRQEKQKNRGKEFVRKERQDYNKVDFIHL